MTVRPELLSGIPELLSGIPRPATEVTRGELEVPRQTRKLGGTINLDKVIRFGWLAVAVLAIFVFYNASKSKDRFQLHFQNTVFDTSTGDLYVYDAAKNSWIRRRPTIERKASRFDSR